MLNIDYTIHHPFFPYSYGIDHLEAAMLETTWKGRVVHVVIGLAEISLPLINYIIALFDWIILSPQNPPPGAHFAGLGQPLFASSPSSVVHLVNPQLLEPSKVVIMELPLDPVIGKTALIKERLNLPITLAEAHYYISKGILPLIGLDAIAAKESASKFNAATSFNSPKFITMCCMVGRLQVIAQAYKNTHYTFRHANMVPYYIYLKCMRELIKKYQFEDHLSNGMHFRLPHSVDKLDNTASFLHKHPGFKSAGAGPLLDHSFSNELLSVDTNPWNQAVGGSSLCFLATGGNITQNAPKLFEQMFINYVPYHVSQKLAKEATQIAEDMRVQSLTGALYLFCVPKEVIDDPNKTFAYRSHPGGYLCTCKNILTDKQILEDSQEGRLNRCAVNRTTLQYRLLAPHLMKEEVHTYWVDSLSPESKSSLNNRLKKLIDQAYFYSRLHELNDMPGDADISYFQKALTHLKPDAICVQRIIDQKNIKGFSKWFKSISGDLLKASA